MVLDAGLKLLIGAVFVFIGWKVYGALLGVVFGTSIAFLFSLISLKKIMNSKESKAEAENIYGYSFPTFFITFIVAIFYNIDLLISRIFFSPETSGFYAIASTLGKMIFLGTQPISKAMFPIAVEKNIKKEKTGNLFLNSIFLVVGGTMSILLLFYFFSDWIILIFTGENITQASDILLYVGTAVGLTAIANLNLIYKLSNGHTKGYVFLAIFVLVEVLLLSIFSSNLLEYSAAFVASSAFFLWGSIFLPKKQREV